MNQRALTPAETALAHSVFGDALDYDQIRLINRKWAFFQPRQTVMAPRGCIHFNPRGDLYCDDFCAADPITQGLFIHELVHVWQHQQGVNLILRRHPWCRYDYALRPGWRLERYGIEQQAEIVRHYFLLRAGFHIPGAPPLDQYRGLLPFNTAH